MLIRQRRGWAIPEREVTPESVCFNRREVLVGLAESFVLRTAENGCVLAEEAISGC